MPDIRGLSWTIPRIILHDNRVVVECALGTLLDPETHRDCCHCRRRITFPLFLPALQARLDRSDSFAAGVSGEFGNGIHCPYPFYSAPVALR